MILRSSPTSPFGRKIKLAAYLLGLVDRLQIVPAVWADPSDNLRIQNPLGKIPVLVLDDGTTLFDSRVIAEFFAEITGNQTLFPRGTERWPALRMQALVDGITDAAVLQVYEDRYHAADRRSDDWVSHQQGKIDRALDALEAQPPAPTDAPHIGHLALAATLGWFDFRFGGRWREGRPRLVAWFENEASRLPGFAETAPAE